MSARRLGTAAIVGSPWIVAMGKKSFISKKNATKYDLVFRPSSDPNAAPEREWVESSRKVGIGRPDVERLAEQTHTEHLGRFPPGHPLAWLHEPQKSIISEERRKEIVGLGFPDDGYDYLQHLRQGRPAQPSAESEGEKVGENSSGMESLVETAYGGPSVYIPAPNFEAPPEDYKAIDASRLTIHQAATTDDDAMVLGGGATSMARELHTVRKRFQQEIDQVEQLMQQLENVDEEEDGDLLEDFLLTATEAGKEVRFEGLPDKKDEAKPATIEDEVTGEEGSEASSAGSYRLEDEQTPSENRSFASTYWRPERTDRNANLSVIDERFEQLALEYDSDEIGELDGDEDEPSTRGPATTDQYSRIMDDFLAVHATRLHAHEGGIRYEPPTAAAAAEGDEEAFTAAAALAKTKERLRCMEEAEAAAAGDDADRDLQLLDERPRETWDCESVLSTRSTLYNHPSRLDAGGPAKPKSRGQIKLSQKTGLPVLVEDDTASAAGSRSSHQTAAVVAPPRKAGETPEEKKQRKEAVKEAKRQARANKKDLKLMFKEEAQKQKLATAPAVSSMRIA